MRIDKGFSWEYPLSVHGLMHSVITNAFKGVTPPSSCTKIRRVPQSTCACVPGRVSMRLTGLTAGCGARRLTKRTTALYDPT